MKNRLLEDIQSRAKPTITTKPPPPPEDISGEEEFDEGAVLLKELQISLNNMVE